MRQLRSSLRDLVLHLHPRLVPAEALRFSRTLGAGGAAVALFLLAASTGALLLAVYEPSPERAHASVSRLGQEVPFGALLRSAHYWAGNGAIAVSSIHMLRVFFRGAHLPPRQLNWIVGLVLLALVAAAGYTGRLLPWDQLGFWSVHISSGMLEYLPLLGGPLLRLARGGAEVGPRTLSLFFGLHVAILPLASSALLAVHVWLVRRAGGILLPDSPFAGDGARERRTRPPPETTKHEPECAGRDLVPVAPDLVLREGVAALVTVAAVLLLAAVADAPLLAQANPGMSPDPAKAPWFLAGVQELLVHVHPTLGVLLPLLAIALLVSLPAVGRGERPSGRWFQSSRGARLVLASAIGGALLTALMVLVDEPFRHGHGRLSSIPPWARSGLLPLLIAGAMVALVAWLARRRGASRFEVTQAAATFVLAAFVVLTLAGILFRGPGMALSLPFAGLSRGNT